MRSTPRSLAALVLLLLVVACDTGTDVGPPSRIQRSNLPTPVVAGQIVDVSVTVKDKDDRPVMDGAVTWTPAGGGTVSPSTSSTNENGVASTRWTLGTTAGTQTLVAAIAGVDATFTADVGPDDPVRIVVTPGDTTLQSVGDTLVLTATGYDQYDNEATPAGLQWQSSSPTVASVTNGVVVSRAEGVADIVAIWSTVSAGITVTVDQVVVGIGVDPASPIMALGETLDLTARPVDARGSTVDTALSITWSSSNEAVAPVSGTGVVDALTVGEAVITATAPPFMGEAPVVVKQGPRPAITGISPAVLTVGDTAIITGTDFSPDPALDVVTVADAPATVLAASTTELTVEMPGPGAFPCAPTGDMDVVVSVDELATSMSHPVAGAPQHSLAVGGSVALFGNDVACSELSEPGTYVISVFYASPSPVTTTAFRLQGRSATAALADRAMLPRIELASRRPAMERDPELLGHLQVLDASRRLVEQLGAPARSTAPAPIAAEQVGDLRTFRIPDIEGNLCSDYTTVTARAVHVGTYGVIWEDTLAPVASQMDGTWDDLGTEYDQVMHQTLLDYFGDPLVLDADLDNNGLFYMLFSETVNDFQSPAVNGFVSSGDFYTRAQCPASNHGEIFYGRVPTSAATGYGEGEIGLWQWQMRSTVIHEVKHLTAYANKFDINPSNPNLEETGLEEATARLAEEFYGRALQGYGQLDNVTYAESIECERFVGPNHPACDAVPLIMGKHYSGINAYLKAPELLSPFGPVDDTDASFYGSGWQLVRWAIDHSGRPEADFVKELIREPSLTGAPNLADKAGITIQQMLADYTLAFAVDDHPSGTTPARSELTLPSWDTRDIFQGLYDGYAGTTLADYYPTPWPLEPHALAGGDFQVDVGEIHGGGAAIFELSGMSNSQLLQLLSAAGGSAPGALGLSIVRIQ